MSLKLKASLMIKSIVHCTSLKLDLSEPADLKTFHSEEIKIDYGSCQHEFYDYEDEDCHRTMLPNTTIEKSFGDGVRNCCGFPGYMVDGGQCSGYTIEVNVKNCDM